MRSVFMRRGGSLVVLVRAEVTTAGDGGGMGV